MIRLLVRVTFVLCACVATAESPLLSEARRCDPFRREA
jgi:hypothetical protein